MFSRTGILFALAAFLAIGLPIEASADNVDWSEYMETKSDKAKPLTITHPDPVKTVATTTTTAKPAKAKKATKARGKRPARKARRR